VLRSVTPQPSPMEAVTTSDRLPRTLSLWSSIALVVGITIGSGIFRSPAAVARHVSSPAAMMGGWIAGGMLTLCGALSFAELAAALPQTGGFYAYLREGWGRRAAFLFGWTQLVVLRASALGGVAIVFGEYSLRALDIEPGTHVIAARTLAAAAIVLAATLNILGTRLAAAVVNISSTTKFLALGLLIAAALALGGTHGGGLDHLTAAPASSVAAGGLGLALVSVLWAYDGFADLSFAAGEVRNPQRNLPIAIIGGTAAVIAVYVLANLAYLYVLPLDRIRQSPIVAADTMMAIFGRVGAALVSCLVATSAFSSLNGIMLSSPRVFFAMAEDGLLFAPLARIHGRFKTPHVAILLAAVLGTTLVLSQTFETLSNTFVLAIWPFYALSVAAIYRLRRIRPQLARPYRVAGYPVVPAIFILAVGWFVANALITEPVSTGLTFALILAGLPIYQYCFAGTRPAPATES
jgi:APA family basic amino acid/polyamine antiporter